MIHALFTPEQFSAWHRVAADELWCFQAGDRLELFVLADEAPARCVRLGGDLSGPIQHAVPAQTWQAARVAAGGAWSLVTCVAVPGFEWEDFELGGRDALSQQFTPDRKLIQELSRVAV